MPNAKLRSILAASDLGPASDEVVRSAAVLAGRLAADLHLVHALDLARLPPLEAPTYPDRVRQAERLLAEQARRVAPSVQPTSVRVIDYEPHRAIEELAAAVSADLVALGPHGGGDVGAYFLGTTAEAVLRAASVPCLVVRSGLHDPLRRLGVPTDFSEPSRSALDLAVALAVQLGGEGGTMPELRVFHRGWSVEAQDDPALEERELRPQLERAAAVAARHAGGGPVPPIRTEVVWASDPAQGIAAHAQQERMDLLVMGTHGRGGLKRLLLGSVALDVTRSAPVPVLLVPPPPGE